MHPFTKKAHALYKRMPLFLIAEDIIYWGRDYFFKSIQFKMLLHQVNNIKINKKGDVIGMLYQRLGGVVFRQTDKYHINL